MINEDRKKLYDALSSEYDLGTYEEFERNIGDSVKRRKLYDAASADYDLGDFESYSQRIGPTHKESLDAFTAEHGSWLNDFEARDSAETKKMVASSRSGLYMPSENAISGEERQRYMELHKQEEALKKAWFTSDEYLAQKDADALFLSNVQKDLSRQRVEYAQANAPIKQEGLFQINPYAVRGVEADTELERFATASRLMDDAIKMHNAPSRYDDKNVFLKFGKGAGDVLSNADFWTAGLTEVADNLGVRDVLSTVQEKLGNLNDLSEDAIENILSPAEKAVLQAWAINTQEQLKRKDDLSRAYQAGQGATESLGFMAEFALTGGIGKAATEGTEAMAKWLGKKALTKVGGMTDDVAAKVLKETGEKIAQSTVGKYGVSLAESLAEAAGRTGVMPSTFRNISEKATEIQTDENGNNYLVKMNDAFAKGYVDSFIENLSEGGRVNALGTLFGDVAGKIPAYKKMVDKFSHTKASELWDAFNSSGVMNTLRAGGWHGLGEEYLEEWYGNALRTLTGVDKEALKDFATVDNQIVTLTSFLPMTIFGGTVSTAQVLSANKDLEKKAAALKSALMERGYDEAQANNMIDMMRGAAPAEVSETLTPIVNAVAGKNVNEAAALMKPVGEFAEAVQRWQSFNTKYNYQEQEQRDGLRAQMEENLGQFWQQDENGRQTVQRGVNEKGEVVYMLGKPSVEDVEAGVTSEVAAVASDGRKVFVNPSEYQLEDELEMNTFLGNEIMAEKGNQEQARMIEEKEAKIAAIRETAVPGTAVNIGTAEAPMQAIVIQRNPDGVIVNTPDGQTRQITYEEFGNYVGVNAVPMTDAQIDEHEADVLTADRAQREAALDQEYENEDAALEELSEAEDEIEQAVDINTPLPMKADGSVDQTALWNTDPLRWAQWNDEQRQDGGANSLGYINGAIAKESAALAEMQAAYEAESDFDARDAMEAEINKKTERLGQLAALQNQYVAAQQAAAAPAVETAPAQEEAVAPRVSQQMSEEEKAQMDAQHQARLEKAKSTAAKREAMQAYVNEISQGSVPMTLISMDGYEQVMKDVGCSPNQIAQVKMALAYAKRTNRQIPAFYVPRVGIFAFVENIPDIEQLRLTYVHERQHQFTAANKSYLNAILQLGLSRERMAEIVYELSGSDFYKDDTADALADEIISYAMERAYTYEDFSVALQELGIEQEIIDIITEIDNEQRSDNTTYSSRRGGRSNLHDDSGRQGNRAENDRNQEPISGGLLDEQGDRPLGLSDRGTRSTEEGAEVISEEQLDAPYSGDPSQITAADGEVIADTNGKGGVRFSIRTWREGGRDYLAAWLDNDKTLTDEEKADILARMDEFYENAQKYTDTYAPFGTWSEAAVRYDNNGNPLMSVIKANGDYAMNLDFSLVCKKRRPLNRLLRTLINRNAFGTYSLKEREIAEINWILQEHGFEVACALCFVDSKRYRVTGVADVFAALYNKLVKTLAPAGAAIAHFNYSNNPNVEVIENGIDTLADDQLNWEAFEKYAAGFKEGSVESKVAQLLRENPSQRRLVDATDFIEAEGFEAVKANNQELLKLYNSKKGTGGPKASFGDVQYLNDILKKEKNFDVAKAYAVGGVRIQSFSDFVPHMYFDYMQLFAELAAKKLPAHAYTKEVLFAKIFGLTGLKINLSLVPAVIEGGVAPGLDAEGNYAWADAVRDTEGNIIQQAQSFPFDEAMAIQNAEGYSKNCGAIAVGISDEHIEKMLDDPNIQFIIPYHKSSLNAIVARMTNIDQYKDYTNVQTTKKASGTKLDKGTKDFNFNEYLHNLGESGTPQQAAQAYLDWCKENNFRPKFSQFAYHPNYYKLLVDFNTIDTTTGEYTPQGAVTMTFPTEQNAFGNVETLIEQGLGEDAQLEEKMETEIDQIADEVESRLAEIAQEPKLSEKQQLKRMAELADERAAQIKARAEGAIDLVEEAQKAEDRHVMMRIIGEVGAQRMDAAVEATTLMDNLAVAREMEEAGKDAKTIKMATGWERGADNKWRLEMEDFEFKAKPGKKKTFKLSDLIVDEALFAAYPELADVKVKYTKLGNSKGGQVDTENGVSIIKLNEDLYKAKNPVIIKAIEEFQKNHPEIAKMVGQGRQYSLTPEQKEIYANELKKVFLENEPYINELGGKETLVHEIQHLIQHIEGFAQGGNSSMIDTTDPTAREEVETLERVLNIEIDNANDLVPVLKDIFARGKAAELAGDRQTALTLRAEYDQKRAEWDNHSANINAIKKDLRKFKALGYEGYRKLAGEVEARNAEQRMNMPYEERRSTLLSETEDVAREEQIFLRDNVMMKADEYQASVRFRFTPRTEEQREQLFEKAKAHDGLTNNFNASGYMLPDGSLLDFSEANDGGDPNRRSLDHRDIEGLIMDEGKEYDSRYHYVVDFVDEGAIRMLPEYAGFQLSVPPTAEQRSRLMDYIYKHNGEVIMEITDQNGSPRVYMEYNKRTSPSRIFKDMDEFFNNGTTPGLPPLRFRVTPEQDKAYMDAVEAGDMETAQRMVDEAARAAGYDSPKLYHGTQGFGFTKIDTRKSDDRISFFATESPAIARSYSSVDGERQISDAPSKEEIKKAAQEWGEAAEESLLEYAQRLYARLSQDQEIDADEFMLEFTDMVYSIEARVEAGELTLGEAVYEIYDVFDTILNKYYNKQKYDSIQKFLNEKPAVWEERVDVARAYFDYFNKLINGGSYGNYALYASTWGMLEVDCKGSNWNDIKSADLPDKDYSTTIMGKPWKTRGVARYAKEEGYKGVIFKNIVDPGGRAHVDKEDRVATIYDFFDPQQQVKSADPVTYDNNGNVIPLSERFNPENSDIRFRMSNENQAIFVSNAAKAVEGIQMGKATPEQWLKMIEKNGGLKAGEDKWMGLSDWLKASDKKTLTKDEVLQFINENMIQIEEQHYEEGALTPEERKAVHDIFPDFNEKITKLDEIPSDWFDSELQAKQAQKMAVESISDEHFADFVGSVILPTPSKALADKINSGSKEILIKRGVFAKNAISHNFTPEQSRNILASSLYSPNLYGQSQKTTRPLNWVVIRTGDKNEATILEVNDSKDYLEVVSWYTMDSRNLDRIKRQAKREGGEILILDSEESLAASLSALPSDLSSEDKDSNNLAKDNGTEENVRYRVVTDQETLDRLNSEPTIKVYRAMQLIDGKLYPPMSAKVDGELRQPIELGQWEEAEERPDLVDEKGRFKLDKGNKSSLKARYNPYFHTSPTPLNDQFSSAQTRPELVTVEVEVPESELTSGYKAEKAKDSVGKMEWKAGVVQSKLSGTRTVILSRWDKPVRIVPDSEVADVIVDMFEGRDITMPSNVVTPSLRAELEKRGVPFVETDNQGNPVEEVSFRVTGTPTDEVVTNGLQLTPAQTAEVAANIFAALPEESRKRITDSLNGNLLGLQDAIMQIPVDLAIKENWNDEDKEMADVVAEQMTKAVGKEMTRPFSAPEALWTLYNAVNKETDLVSEASRALVRRNLGFGPETLEMENQAREDVRFRTVGNANSNALASLYNRGAVNVWTRLKESFVDMQASVEELVKAIEKKTGKVAQGFENILLALNQQSSKGLAAMESYEQKFLKPMFDEIRRIMDETKMKYEDVVRYVILKHGLERNKKLAQRDARAHYQEIYDDIISKITGMTAAQKRTYLTNAQLKEGDAKAELATLQAVDMSAMADEEKREHKKKLAAARKAVEETEEHLKRAQKIASLSEQEAQDELDKIFEKIENGTDSVYKEMRENDYSGISSMFYDQLGVDRKNFSTEEQYQAALMEAKKDRYSTLKDIETAAEAEVKSFEGKTDTKELWKRINAATKETLRQQYDANMISKDQYLNLRDMFEYYVPLRGFKDNTAEDMYTYYRKPNSTGYTKPILGAEGRKTEAESPFGWIAAMAGSAIASNVKNEAKLALYYFVSNRPENGIATISKTWFVDSGEVDERGKKIFKPAYPPFSENLSSAEGKAQYEIWQANMKELQKKGQAYEAGQRLNLGNAVVNISDANKPEHIVNVKVGGKDYTIIINGNPRAAQAINGDLNIEGTSQDYSALFGPVLRWMSSVNTSYNPEFWITNMMRDMAFTMMAVNIKEDPAYRRKFSKNYRKAFKVISLVAKNEKGTIGDSYLEQQYKDFVKYGGVTGYTQIKDSETWEHEIENYLSSTDPESLKSGKVMRGMKSVFHAAHRFGESLEQVSRFAAFLTARETGKSINEAINDAKEITVNFNRKGSGKMITLEEAKYLTGKNGQPLTKPQQWMVVGLSSIAPLGRRFIMFFNAAIQGLNATYKLKKKNPKRFTGWALGYAAVGMMNAVFHAMLDDDDDYLDIPQYERRNSLMIGGNGAYFKWALPQEARAFYALGDLAVETVMGRNPHQNVLGEALKIGTEILPVNPSEGWKAFMPSVAIPFIELALNEDYKGAPIYNEQKWLSEEEKERTAKWSNAYQGTGWTYVKIAQGLNFITGGDKHDAGWINLQPEKLEHLVQSAFGGTIRTADKFINTISAALDPEEPMTIRQAPFLNRFLTINDERFKNVHVNDVFDYYKADAEHALTLEKRYIKDRDMDSLTKLRSSDEYQWAKIYGKYKKPLKAIQDKIKVADGTAEKKELMKQQDELKKRMIKEISEL